MKPNSAEQFWLDTYPKWFAPDFPEAYESVLDKFHRTVKAAPEKPCIAYFDKVYSYGEVDAMARAMAAGLEKNQVGKGDRVLFVLQNIPQSVIASLAVWMRNATVVPVNPMCTTKDLKNLLADCGAKWIVCEEELYEKSVRGAISDQRVITTSPLDFLAEDQAVPEQLKAARKKTFETTMDFMDFIKDFDKDVDWLILNGWADDKFDLFGDGTIKIYFTPGHTPGHQSILVNLPDSGPMFFAVDACYTTENFEGVLPGLMWNAAESVRSVERMRFLQDVQGVPL